MRRLWYVVVGVVGGLVGLLVPQYGYAQIPVQITDHQQLEVVQEPQEFKQGPFDLLNLTIPKDTEFEFVFDVSHQGSVLIGRQGVLVPQESFAFQGPGGAINTDFTVYLQGGESYTIQEIYTLVATLNSELLQGKFLVERAVEWTVTPPHTGRYRLFLAGTVQEFHLDVEGDVAGQLDLNVIGNTVRLPVVTTRPLPPGSVVLYTAAYQGTFDRFATLRLEEQTLPPWDLNGDNIVNLIDLVLAARDFGRLGEGLIGDVDDNGMVTVRDIVLIARHFGEQWALVAPSSRLAAQVPVTLGVRRISDGAVRVSVEPPSGLSIAAADVELEYDPNHWRLVEVRPGARIVRPYVVPVEGSAHRARVLVVSLPIAEGTRGSLAEFRFVPVRADAALGAIQVRKIQWADAQGSLWEGRSVWSRPLSGDLVPTTTQLLPNYPNPFNPETWIPFTLDRGAPVRLEIYSERGALVRRFDLGWQPAGEYVRPDRAVRWDGRNALGEPVPSGVYWVRFQAGSLVQTRRLVVTK